MIVTARHPSVVRHVPAGGRHERVSVVALETPVTLREAGVGDFREITGTDGKVLLDEGRLWMRVDLSDRMGEGSPCAPGDFAAWLSGGAPPRTAQLGALFRRTPLSAATSTVSATGFVQHGNDRGEARQPRSREILRDGRPGAPARLQGWLDDNLRIVGDRVLIRIEPLAQIVPDGGDALVLLSMLHHQAGDRSVLVDIDRIGEAIAADPSLGKAQGHGPVEEILGILSGREPRRDGARKLALSLPGDVLDAVARLPRIGVAVPLTLQRLADALGPPADAAMTGTVDEVQIPAVLTLAEEAAALLSELGPPIDHAFWRGMRDHLRSGLVNGYGESHREDEMALGGLAPAERPGSGVTLRALDLLSKGGFEDGDLLDEILEEGGYDWAARPLDDVGEDGPSLGASVLAACVRRHLGPYLDGFEIVEGYSQSHNPVRLAEWDGAGPVVRSALEGVEVQVSRSRILEIAAGLAPGFVDPRPATAPRSLPGR